MNRKQYNSDTRYAKVLEQTDLLGIMDVTTTRQHKNGTIVWKLPIKDQDSGILIEVASFTSGYVRNQGKSCHSNYQLNKRVENQPTYYKDYKWVTKNDGNGDYGESEWTGKYQKFTTRGCKLIPIEIDRLEYLISYCIKNYYIKHANFVADGEYIPKWRYDNLVDAARLDYDCGHYDRISKLEDSLEESDYRIKDLERMLDGHKGRETNHDQELEKAHNKIKKLDDFIESSKRFSDSMYEGRNDRVKELESDVRDLESKYQASQAELDKAEKNEFYPYSMEIRVNGQKYKVV